MSVVNRDRGRMLMDRISENLHQLDGQEQQALSAAQFSATSSRSRASTALVVGALAALMLLVLLIWLVAHSKVLDRERQRAEQDRENLVQELSKLATHDALTGLPDRRLAADRLEQALVRTPQGAMTAVLYIDLDRFKLVNDQHGHRRGDEVLVESARRMRAALRPADTLARVGGDEFIAICEGLGSRSDGHALAPRLRLAAGQSVGGIRVDASIGVVFQGSPAAGSAEELLDSADAAMYAAKQRGRGQVVAYDGQIAHSRQRRQEDVAALTHALSAGQLWVACQPILRLDTETIVGTEALLRWSHPEHGLIPPDQFIGTADESGLILPTGEFVLRAACEQTAAWNGARVPSPVPHRHRQGGPQLCRRSGPRR